MVGTFSVEIEVGNPSREEFVAVEALVDTGAIYTMLPEDLLERLGVEPYEARYISDGGRQPGGILDRKHGGTDPGKGFVGAGRLRSSGQYTPGRGDHA